MGDIKISELGSMIAVTDSDVMPIVNSGSPAATNKVAASVLKKYAIGNNNISGIGDGSATGGILALNSSKADKTIVSDNVEAIGSTSVGSYSAGQIFPASNGKVYKATATITAGTTALVIGTNCEETTIGEELSGVGSEIQALTNNLNAVSDKVSKSSDVYNPNKNGGYKVGDLCISPTDGALKKCTTAITTAGVQWSTAQNYFTDATLTDVVSMINHSLPIIISGHDSITIPANSSVSKAISLPRNVPNEDTVCVLTGLLGGDWEKVKLVVDWINHDTVWMHGINNSSSELTKNFRWCVIHS